MVGLSGSQKGAPAMTKPIQPAEQLRAGKAYFSNLGLDVRHFGAIWHVFKIGQLMATDLNGISQRHGISIADFHLLSALMINLPEPMRASDLAHALNVTNAALSVRIRRLERLGLLACRGATKDKREKFLSLTEAGPEVVAEVGFDLEQSARFIAHFRQLSQSDQEDLTRIAAQLHTFMARDFEPVPRR